MDVDPVGADARLTADSEVFDRHGVLDRPVEVRVVEDDERGVAAQFERHALELRRGLGHQDLADLGGPRERDLADAAVAHEHVRDRRRAPAHHDVEDARRKAGLGERPRDLERGEGGLLRGLEHDRAPGRQRGGDLPQDHRGGEVPRRDRRDDADRFLGDNDALVALMRRNDIAIDALGFLGKPLDEGGGIGDLALGLRQRLALFGGHQDGQIVLVFHHQVEPFAQDIGTFLGGLLAPRAPGGHDAGGARGDAVQPQRDQQHARRVQANEIAGLE